MLQMSMNANCSQQFVVIHVKITTDHSPVVVRMAMNWSLMEELANVSKEKMTANNMSYLLSGKVVNLEWSAWNDLPGTASLLVCISFSLGDASCSFQ